MMKKTHGRIAPLLLALILAAGTFPGAAFAAGSSVSVSIPNFKVTVNGRDIDSTRMQYPLIVYNEISYFPLTWAWCRELGLVSGYTAADGLYIARDVGAGQDSLDGGGRQTAGSRHRATIADYPVYINGQRIDNSKEPYPLLNFRDITYFPLTWRFVTEEFGWDQSWGSASGYALNAYGKAEEPAPGSRYYQESLNMLPENYREYAILERLREERAIGAAPEPGGGYNDAHVGSTDTYYRLDYATDTISEIASGKTGDVPYLSGAAKGEDAAGLFAGKGAVLHFRESALLDLSKDAGAGNAIDKVFATKHAVGGLAVYLTAVYFTQGAESVPPPYTPVKYYAWIEKGGNPPRQVASWPVDQSFAAVYPFGADGVYLTSQGRVFGSSRQSNSRGWVCAVNASLSETTFNGRWEDWNSLRAIGMDDVGNLYLRNTWFPDYDKATEQIYNEGGVQISPIRDGYYRLDTSGNLTKIYPYVGAESMIVSPTGGIYVEVTGTETILHLQSGKKIR
jgi:hypothetical protein